MSDYNDPIVDYLQACIREDIDNGDRGCLEMDQSLLSLYQCGLITGAIMDGEWKFTLTAEGKRVNMINLAETMFSGVQIEA